MGTTGKKNCLEIYEYLGIKVGNLIGLVKWTLDFNPKMHFQTRHLQACGGKEGGKGESLFKVGGILCECLSRKLANVATYCVQ